MLEFVHDYYKDNIEKKRISRAKSFSISRAYDDGLWFAWVHYNRNRWKKNRRYSKKLLDDDWFYHVAIDPTNIKDSSAWREKYIKVTDVILNKLKQSRIENPKVWRQQFMDNVERNVKPFKSNDDAWDYLFEFERLGKQIKVENKKKLAHKKLVGEIYVALKRMDIEERLKKISPNLLLFPELHTNNITTQSRKKLSKKEFKKNLFNAQMELGIQGQQLNLIGV